MDKLKCWVKNVTKKLQWKVKVEVWLILNYIFNPTSWVCPYLTQSVAFTHIVFDVHHICYRIHYQLDKLLFHFRRI